jgi:hypothetical protein
MDEVITIKCGYEGCDWDFNILKNNVTAEYIVEGNRYPLVYIAHVIKVHGIPPAKWEHRKTGNIDDLLNDLHERID